MSVFKALSMPIAAAMLATNMFAPAIGGRSTPRFVPAAPVYDGNDHKVRPKQHPRHNAKRLDPAWLDYARRVEATHRLTHSGAWQEDPRDDKYLHSHARAFRGLRKAIDRRAA